MVHIGQLAGVYFVQLPGYFVGPASFVLSASLRCLAVSRLILLILAGKAQLYATGVLLFAVAFLLHACNCHLALSNSSFHYCIRQAVGPCSMA